MDRAIAEVLLVALALLGVAYAVRLRRVGAARFARAEREKGSALLGAGVLHAGYWSLSPIARVCVRAGITAAAITWCSLLLGIAAGLALATGHFGLGALLACVSAIGDMLDGEVARMSKTASDAGEVLDASVDRYVESAFLFGIAFAERADALMFSLAIVALVGSWMVSYSTAKAEALHVTPPRGAMRRAERAVYLLAGTTFTPILAPWLDRPGAAPAVAHLPLAAALALVAVLSNVSAVQRLAFVARAVRPDSSRARDAQPSPPSRGALWKQVARHQLASVVSTAVDFGTMVLLVSGIGVDPVPATAAGAACGALTNFTLGRRWIFRAHDGSATSQALRYAIVSGASLGLNTFGEWLVHVKAGQQYVVARAIVAVVVSLAWNFPMHKWFVFRAPRATSVSVQEKA